MILEILEYKPVDLRSVKKGTNFDIVSRIASASSSPVAIDNGEVAK
jgi:hypothetical protein